MIFFKRRSVTDSICSFGVSYMPHVMRRPYTNLVQRSLLDWVTASHIRRGHSTVRKYSSSRMRVLLPLASRRGIQMFYSLRIHP